MKRILALFTLAYLAFQVPVRAQDYLPQKDFQAEKKKIYDNLRTTGRQVAELRKADATLLTFIDSLGKITVLQSKQLATANDSLTQALSKIANLEQQLATHRPLAPAIRGAMIAVILLVFVVLFYLLMQQAKRVTALTQAQEALEKKTGERIDALATELRENIRQCDQRVIAVKSDLLAMIQTGLDNAAERTETFVHQVRDELAGLSGKLDRQASDFSSIAKKQEADRV
ncbi:MAG TPA: hypothetical protein PKG48_04135, partial [Bacteroidales bacterium]|nr:hypothetical protein [Bacteroidales bacterium]